MSLKFFIYIFLYLLLIFILNNQMIRSFDLDEKFPLTYTLSNGDIFIITAQGFRVFNSSLNNLKSFHNFTSNFTYTVSEATKTTIAQFTDDLVIVLCMNKLFICSSEGIYISEIDLGTDLTGNYYSLIPHKKDSNNNYYYIIAFFKENQISIKYYQLTMSSSSLFQNIILLYDNLYTSYNSNNESSILMYHGLSCQIMSKNNNDVLTCFFEIQYPQALSSKSFNITNMSINEINMEQSFSSNNGATVIKSKVSSDKKTAFICYIVNNNGGSCLQYYIDSNKFSTEIKCFNSSKETIYSMNIFYFEETGKYIFISNDNNKKYGLYIVAFNSNFESSLTNGNSLTEPNYVYDQIYDFDFLNILYIPNKNDYFILNGLAYNGNLFFSQINLSEILNFNNNLIVGNTERANESDNEIIDNNNDTKIISITDKIDIIEGNVSNKTLDTIENIVTSNIEDIITDNIDDIITDMIYNNFTNIIDDITTEINEEIVTDNFIFIDNTEDIITENLEEIINDSIIEKPIDKIEDVKESQVAHETIEYENTKKTKEEIINDLDNLIKSKDPKLVYLIKGDDFSVIIKPVNVYVEESTVNIDFSECEKKLKDNYSDKKFRVLQVNMENKNENCLVDQVEYKIYDELGENINLSICSNVDIILEYKIKNTSLLNLEQISNFKEQGVDIFNIKHEFFNDICYPHSDNSSSSDMILSDRVTDIYQNFSICGKECEYKSFNLDKLSANCYCKVKEEVNSEMEEGNFQTYIASTFIYSNFGVAKCYNLVFNLKGKLKNVGFLIFGCFIIFHIPIYIFYFINGINPIIKYINNEMDTKGYSTKNKNEKKSIISKKGEQTKEISTENNRKYSFKIIRSFSTKNVNSNPPKKNKTKRIILAELYPKNNKCNNNNSKLFNDEINENNNDIQKQRAKSIIHINYHSLDKKDSPDNEQSKKIKIIKRIIIDSTSLNYTNFGNENIKISSKDDCEREDIKDFRKNKVNTKNFNIYSTSNNDDKNYKKLKQKDKKVTKKLKIKRYNSIISEINSKEALMPSEINYKNNSKNIISNQYTISDENKPNHIKLTTKDVKSGNMYSNINNNEFHLILINANNTGNHKPLKSNYILNNYNYDEAINYDKRSFCRIFFI